MIVSIHNYDLAESATEEDLREAVQEAERRGLFDLPGLVEYQFLQGIKGVRTGEFTAMWTYQSRKAWQEQWGPVDDPVSKEEYPDRWVEWEDDLLAPILADEPDEIEYTSHELIHSRG